MAGAALDKLTEIRKVSFFDIFNFFMQKRTSY